MARFRKRRFRKSKRTYRRKSRKSYKKKRSYKRFSRKVKRILRNESETKFVDSTLSSREAANN